jgi:hypothetical protein
MKVTLSGEKKQQYVARITYVATFFAITSNQVNKGEKCFAETSKVSRFTIIKRCLMTFELDEQCK